MKDENDKKTGELLPFPAPGGAGQSAPADARPPAPGRKPRRLPRQSAYRPPAGAKPEKEGERLGWCRSVVPVSSVARDMGISARRVRVMLKEGRLMGRQLDNGYWEVFYPYQYIIGTRGPALKRQRNLPPPTRRKFTESVRSQLEGNSEWW